MAAFTTSFEFVNRYCYSLSNLTEIIAKCVRPHHENDIELRRTLCKEVCGTRLGLSQSRRHRSLSQAKLRDFLQV